MKKVRARWFHKGRISPVRLIVIHDMEWAERSATAEDCARMFATMTRQASAHVCVDNDTAVRCVEDGDTAWSAPGANADGLQLELAGFAKQSKQDWLDEYGIAMLEIAAKVCADWCRKYNIPVRRLTRAELAAGKKGFTSHADVSAVYKRSDHGDPGAGFPWDYLLARVKDVLSGANQPAPAPVTNDQAEAPPWPSRHLTYASGVPTFGNDVKTWQRQMRARGWSIAVDGVYGERSRAVCLAFQREKGLVADGIVGRRTWEAAWEAPI